MISIALSTMVLTITATDEQDATPLPGGTTRIMDVINTATGRSVDAVSYPIALNDEGDGTYTWKYPDEFRLALGRNGHFRAEVEFVLDGDYRYVFPPISVQRDIT